MTTHRISLSERQVENWLNEEVVGQGIPRRSFLKRTGFFLVGFSLAGCTRLAELETGSADFGQLDPTQLDSWLAISQDGNVTLFFGKVDNGQGVFTALSAAGTRSCSIRSQFGRRHNLVALTRTRTARAFTDPLRSDGARCCPVAARWGQPRPIGGRPKA